MECQIPPHWHGTRIGEFPVWAWISASGYIPLKFIQQDFRVTLSNHSSIFPGKAGSMDAFLVPEGHLI